MGCLKNTPSPRRMGKMAQNKRYRPDKDGTHRTAFEANKKKIFAMQPCCGICGRPIDYTLKYPHPLSPTIDHIIPIAMEKGANGIVVGGHPSAIENMQAAHLCCNRQKSNKTIGKKTEIVQQTEITNRDLPLSADWINKKMGA